MANQARIASLLREACNLLDGSAVTTTSSTPNPTPNPAYVNTRSTVRSMFQAYRNPGNHGRRRIHPQEELTQTWTHKFFCLARNDQDVLPTRVEKRNLQEAGLGEVKVTVNKTNNYVDLQKKLYEQFPKLKEAGGFQLLRTAVNSRSQLELIRVPPGGYTPLYLADRCGLGQTTIYIRPLQRAVSLSPVKNQETEVFCEKCLKCGEEVAVMEMDNHLGMCGNSDSDLDLPRPPAKRPRMNARPICAFACATAGTSSDTVTEKIDWSSCPVCGVPVPADAIEVHADICCENSKSEQPPVERSLDETVSEVRNKLQKNKNWNISIMRSSLVGTTLQMMVDADEEDFFHELCVKFIGEEGVDGGGLRREMFSLFFQQTPFIIENTFSSDSTSLQKGHYSLFGKMASLAFIYGHPGLQRLHKSLVTYILTEKTPVEEISTTECQDAAVLHAISVIEKAGTEDDYTQAAVETGDLLERSAFNKLLTKDSAKLAVYTLKEYHIFYRAFPALRQFMEGLKLHGVLDLLRKHPDEAKKFLATTTATSAEEICNFWQFSFSEKGSEHRKIEETIEFNFRRLMTQIEKGRVSSAYSSPYGDVEKEIEVTLPHVLQALIGCPSLPSDIKTGLVEFNHNSSSLSVVNTCAPSILFQSTAKLQDFDNFKQLMLNIVIGAEGFGQQ